MDLKESEFSRRTNRERVAAAFARHHSKRCIHIHESRRSHLRTPHLDVRRRAQSEAGCGDWCLRV